MASTTHHHLYWNAVSSGIHWLPDVFAPPPAAAKESRATEAAATTTDEQRAAVRDVLEQVHACMTQGTWERAVREWKPANVSLQRARAAWQHGSDAVSATVWERQPQDAMQWACPAWMPTESRVMPLGPDMSARFRYSVRAVNRHHPEGAAAAAAVAWPDTTVLCVEEGWTTDVSLPHDEDGDARFDVPHTSLHAEGTLEAALLADNDAAWSAALAVAHMHMGLEDRVRSQVRHEAHAAQNHTTWFQKLQATTPTAPLVAVGLWSLLQRSHGFLVVRASDVGISLSSALEDAAKRDDAKAHAAVLSDAQHVVEALTAAFVAGGDAPDASTPHGDATSWAPEDVARQRAVEALEWTWERGSPIPTSASRCTEDSDAKAWTWLVLASEVHLVAAVHVYVWDADAAEDTPVRQPLEEWMLSPPPSLLPWRPWQSKAAFPRYAGGNVLVLHTAYVDVEAWSAVGAVAALQLLALSACDVEAWWTYVMWLAPPCLLAAHADVRQVAQCAAAVAAMGWARCDVLHEDGTVFSPAAYSHVRHDTAWIVPSQQASRDDAAPMDLDVWFCERPAPFGVAEHLPPMMVRAFPSVGAFTAAWFAIVASLSYRVLLSKDGTQAAAVTGGGSISSSSSSSSSSSRRRHRPKRPEVRPTEIDIVLPPPFVVDNSKEEVSRLTTLPAPPLAAVNENDEDVLPTVPTLAVWVEGGAVGDSAVVDDTVAEGDSVGHSVGVGDTVAVVQSVGDTFAEGDDTVGDTVAVGQSVGDTVAEGDDTVGDTVAVGQSVGDAVGGDSVAPTAQERAVGEPEEEVLPSVPTVTGWVEGGGDREEEAAVVGPAEDATPPIVENAEAAATVEPPVDESTTAPVEPPVASTAVVQASEDTDPLTADIMAAVRIVPPPVIDEAAPTPAPPSTMDSSSTLRGLERSSATIAAPWLPPRGSAVLPMDVIAETDESCGGSTEQADALLIPLPIT